MSRSALNTTIDTKLILQQLSYARLYPYSERAIVLDIEPSTDTNQQHVLALQAAIWALAKQLQFYQQPHSKNARLLPVGSIENIILGNLNLTVIFNPLLIDTEHCQKIIKQHWSSITNNVDQLTLKQHCKKIIDIPVHYGAANGPDLSAVANYHDLTNHEVIKRHCDVLYTVLFLGFQPGFAYLHGLHSTLATPRRSSPRQNITAGSVGIGGTQTGIYPFSSPGGWQIIGRVADDFTPLFDSKRKLPSLLQAGDQLRFVSSEV